MCEEGSIMNGSIKADQMQFGTVGLLGMRRSTSQGFMEHHSQKKVMHVPGCGTFIVDTHIVNNL